MKRIESKEERIARSKESVLAVIKEVMAERNGSEQGQQEVLKWAEKRFDELEAELNAK